MLDRFDTLRPEVFDRLELFLQTALEPKAGGATRVFVAPSLLSARFDILGSEIEEVESGGAELLHLDIMDGHFVPNISYGPGVVKSIRSCTRLPFDVHLMIENPGDYVEPFAEAGADILSFHVEATDDLSAVLDRIDEAGILPALAIRPDTDLDVLRPYLDRVGMVLVMTVMPGFGGQTFLDGSLERIGAIREWGGSQLAVEVDGGLDSETAPGAIRAGANVIVAGTAVFGENDRVRAIRDLGGGSCRG